MGVVIKFRPRRPLVTYDPMHITALYFTAVAHSVLLPLKIYHHCAGLYVDFLQRNLPAPKEPKP